MAAGRRISRGTGILATIGATAPFVGLFGALGASFRPARGYGFATDK